MPRHLLEPVGRRLDLGGYSTTDKYGAYKRGMKGEEYRPSGEWLAI